MVNVFKIVTKLGEKIYLSKTESIAVSILWDSVVWVRAASKWIMVLAKVTNSCTSADSAYKKKQALKSNKKIQVSSKFKYITYVVCNTNC